VLILYRDAEDEDPDTVPEAPWAKKEILQQALRRQNVEKADIVFGSHEECDLEEIFSNYAAKERYRKRTSSANWDHQSLQDFRGKYFK
jgi:hypothetical protein